MKDAIDEIELLIKEHETTLKGLEQNIDTQKALETNISERIDATYRELNRIREYKDYLCQSREDLLERIKRLQDVQMMLEFDGDAAHE